VELCGVSFMVERIVCILLVVSSGSAWCQHTKDFELFVGGGILTNHEKGAYQEQSQNKIGYLFGAGLTQHVTQSFSLKFRAALEAKGYKIKATYMLGTINQQTHHVSYQLVTDNDDKTINYFTLTMLPTFRLTENFSIGLGVFYGFLKNLNEKFVRTDQAGNIIVSNTSGNTFATNNDMGLVLNASYRVHILKSTFYFQLNESYGVVHYSSPLSMYNIKSGMSSIMLSYVIPHF
jgi:hypothetical protein